MINNNPNFKVWYCKSLKKTGKPIILQDLVKNLQVNTEIVEFKNVDIRIEYNNSTGKAKKSGATTVLEVFLRE